MLDAEKHVVPDTEYSEYVADLFQHFESCGSIRNTLLFLQDRYGFPISYKSISNALKNPLFKGQYRDDPDFCVQIIEPERLTMFKGFLRAMYVSARISRLMFFVGL